MSEFLKTRRYFSRRAISCKKVWHVSVGYRAHKWIITGKIVDLIRIFERNVRVLGIIGISKFWTAKFERTSMECKSYVYRFYHGVVCKCTCSLRRPIGSVYFMISVQEFCGQARSVNPVALLTFPNPVDDHIPCAEKKLPSNKLYSSASSE